VSKVAFIGLGVMGYPMAAHLAARGHEVTVYNRTAAKAEGWIAEHPGHSAASPRAAAAGAEFVFCCVGDDEHLRAVTLGSDGVLGAMAPGAVLTDHTTASAGLARELYAVARTRDLHFIDAPVSGGQAGAEQGRLTVMCGGDAAVFERVQPLIGCYARACVLMGGPGAGQLTKMVNQICIAGLLQGLAEGLEFGRRAGLDLDRVVEVIGQGAAQSWQMDNRAGTMVRGQFNFGFAVDWMRKDLAMCLHEARSNGARLPVAALVDQFYAAVQERGGGRWDTSSLITLLGRD